MEYAYEFNDILPVLSVNAPLRQKVIVLINSKPICHKAIEECAREAKFRQILADLVNRNILSVEFACKKIKKEIPMEQSIHDPEDRTFLNGWEERLVRLHLSRFYNHVILDDLSQNGEEECFIPLPEEKADCIHDDNRKFKVDELLSNMIKFYDLGDPQIKSKIPEHANCPHVVIPLAYINKC